MSFKHRVIQGECLGSIAAAYGFPDWRILYDHPENAAFRRQRPNPNVIRAGDCIVIPERRLKTETCAPERRHQFRIRATQSTLRMRIHDETGTPYSDTRYVLQVDNRRIEGRTDDNGLLEQRIPARASSAELVLYMGNGPDIEGHVFQLNLGHLDPPDEVSGAQSRLMNLGYACSSSGDLDEQTSEALLAFQVDHGLPPSGVLDAATIDRLHHAHDVS